MRRDKVTPALERAGFKVRACMGYRDGVQTIAYYEATKLNRRYTATSLTGLYKTVHKRMTI